MERCECIHCYSSLSMYLVAVMKIVDIRSKKVNYFAKNICDVCQKVWKYEISKKEYVCVVEK